MVDTSVTQAVAQPKIETGTAASSQEVTLPARATVMQLLNGYVNTQIIYVTAKIGLADLLAPAPQPAAQLAAATGLDAHRLHRLLRGGVRCGLFMEDAEGRFALTPLGATLQRDVPGSVRDMALLAGEVWYPAWSGLDHTLQTGEIAFDHVFGTSFFAHLAAQPGAKQRFHHYMAARTGQAVNELLRVYDFAQVTRVIDVGGGNGTLITALLLAHPHLHGMVFDAPGVIEEARQQFAGVGLLSPAPRAEVCGGDFFSHVPEGGDLYLLSQILHDWDDAQCVQILQNCRRAMQEHGRLVILEQLMPPHVQKSSIQVDMDLAMLVLTGGRERTAAEYGALLTAAGLRLTQTLATRFSVAVIEAVVEPV